MSQSGGRGRECNYDNREKEDESVTTTIGRKRTRVKLRHSGERGRECNYEKREKVYKKTIRP